MPVIYKRLIDGSMLTTAAVAYYTAPGETTGVIKQLTFCNTGDDVAAVTAFVGTAGNAHKLLDGHSIAGHETLICYEALLHVVEAGGSIQAFADVAGVVNIIASGCEVA